MAPSLHGCTAVVIGRPIGDAAAELVTTLPHNLAHCVVERELLLERGFWASVAIGVCETFGGITLASILIGR
jgi:hypothetical protein